MGFFNPRARCPNCGGKIHTDWGGNTTGNACQWCGTQLTGMVSPFTHTAMRAPTAEEIAHSERVVRPRPNPEDFRGRPIGDFLEAMGVPVDKERQRELQGTTILRFAPRRKRKTP